MRKKMSLFIDIDNDSLRYKLENEEVEESSLEELESIIKKNHIIYLSYNKNTLTNELISLPNLDKKIVKKYIEKEMIKRKREDLLVDYRYLDKNHIIISTVSSMDIEDYIKLCNEQIKSIRTRLDIMLDYIGFNQEDNFILLNINRSFLELLIFTEEKKMIKRLDLENTKDNNLLIFEIKNLIESNVDLNSIKKVYFISDIDIKEDLSNRNECEEVKYSNIFDILEKMR